jgi:hypothetical protein
MTDLLDDVPGPSPANNPLVDTARSRSRQRPLQDPAIVECVEVRFFEDGPARGERINAETVAENIAHHGIDPCLADVVAAQIDDMPRPRDRLQNGVRRPPRRVVPVHGGGEAVSGVGRESKAKPAGDQRDGVVVFDVGPERSEEKRVGLAAGSSGSVPPRL